MFETPDKKRLKRKSMNVAHNMSTVHAYGSEAIIERRRKFYASGAHEVSLFHEEYQPNPYMFQYELEIDIFLNYEEIKELEIKLAKERGDQDRVEDIEEFGPTGLEPHEHLFIAAEIRWPIKKQDGHWFSKLTPHPWIEKQWKELKHWQFLTVFGGGGQGKTHGFAAFMCMIFDHFICTDAGAKCSFSTVNEDKLKSVVWPYISQRLYPVDEERKPFSLYAGRGKVAGDYTIKRFGKKDKDTGAVMRGILVGHSVQDAAIEDKLTGSHGHIAYVYLLDEMQSTKEAPLKAAANFLSTPKYGWVIGAGNYNKDSDLLGDNVEPIEGWDSVDEHTGEWIALNRLGHRVKVIHQHNDRSPAMLSEKWKKRCTNPITGQCFLPNPERKKKLYPTKASLLTDEHRRMWAGFRNISSTLDLILNPKTIETNGCNLPVNWDTTKPIFHHFSFDPAQGQEGDRNAIMHFMDGYCKDTGMWVWAPEEITTVPKSTDSKKYYDESTDWMINYAAINGIPSGNAIMDWTSRGSHPETFLNKRFVVQTLVYGQKCPDGTKDKKTGRIEEPIMIEPNPEAIHESKFAHTTCDSLSALGAWCLLQYTIYGRVRNINKPLLEPLKSVNLSKTIDKELFTREFEDRVSTAYGERFGVVSKKQFKKEHGFSPDIFDLFLQAAYYMLRYRGMIPSGVEHLPNSLMSQPENPWAEEKQSRESVVNDLNSLWSHDLI